MKNVLNYKKSILEKIKIMYFTEYSDIAMRYLQMFEVWI